MKQQKHKVKKWFQKRFKQYKAVFRKEFLTEKPAKVFKNILLIVIGTAILAISNAWFIIPGDIVNGGTDGLGIIFGRSFHLNIEQINIVITIVTVSFFVVGFFIAGIAFTLKTLISTVVYPPFLFAFSAFRDIPGLEWMKIETYSPLGSPDWAVLTLAGIFGGILTGIGVALSFKGGGSTGGTDCFVVALDKHTKMKASTVSILIDSIVILVGMFVDPLANQKLISGLIGILSAVVCGVLIDKVFVGKTKIYTASIISHRWRKISAIINREMERGTTIYPARGGYTGAQRNVISVSFSRDEYQDFMQIVSKIDPAAFVAVQKVYEIQGYGFSYDDGDDLMRLKTRNHKHRFKQARKAAPKAEEQASKELEPDRQHDLAAEGIGGKARD